jgi:hypothetical protein
LLHNLPGVAMFAYSTDWAALNTVEAHADEPA